ncbi:RNA-directed DNA polymerase, eukaryota, reverse transcriptase zinc-binding domain protein [Tanacetum coccineum]
MVSDKMNDLIDMTDVDEGSDLGTSNENRESGNIKNKNRGETDDNVIENQIEQVCEEAEMENSRDDGCLDTESEKNEYDRLRNVESNGDTDSGKKGTEKRGNNSESIDGTNASNGRTYAKVVTKDMKIVDNKLNFIPTKINEEGSEIVVFDEALVAKGSAQWKLTVCGMKKVLELGPWIVNNKPLLLKKWDPTIGMERVEQTSVPLWVSLVNVPIEAWSIKRISVLTSSLGKPMIMDTMTAKRCKLGEGRLDFARVLVEFDVMKGFKEKIKIQYKEKDNNKKGSKKRNEEVRERNNAGNYMGNRKIKDRKQHKEGRFYNAGAKINEAKGSKGDIWKRKEMNERKHDKTKNTDQENVARMEEPLM